MLSLQITPRQFIMRSSIGSGTFEKVPIEQAVSRVSSAGYTGIDLTVTSHLGRRAVSPGQRMQGDGGDEELEALAVELDLNAKRDAGPVAPLKSWVAENLGREAKP
jgi:hypothetical protein